jgi:DNA (cytosine-5)-methyltransferase 1
MERAGFHHAGLIEIEKNACITLRHNRPRWNVIQADLQEFDASEFKGVDLVCGGLPCPPFSVAGKQLGRKDERNLFPAALRIIRETQPRAVMIENVRGFLDSVFADYRMFLAEQLRALGYRTDWKLFNASDYGVSQLRPRVVIVALRQDIERELEWPSPQNEKSPTVGELLYDLMSANGWRGADLWRRKANEIAPTVVGGSLKHGGPDLGPTRSKRAWETLSVDGHGIASEAPAPDFVGLPRLTVRMVARLQGFPDDWLFSGAKTAAYRQVGNAFPPPVAAAIGGSVLACLQPCRIAQAAG